MHTNTPKKQAAQDIWFVAMSDMGLKSPQSLCRMVLLSYADLKGWQFYYWYVSVYVCV